LVLSFRCLHLRQDLAAGPVEIGPQNLGGRARSAGRIGYRAGGGITVDPDGFVMKGKPPEVAQVNQSK
jgi:hypothetical protein